MFWFRTFGFLQETPLSSPILSSISSTIWKFIRISSCKVEKRNIMKFYNIHLDIKQYTLYSIQFRTAYIISFDFMRTVWQRHSCSINIMNPRAAPDPYLAFFIPMFSCNQFVYSRSCLVCPDSERLTSSLSSPSSRPPHIPAGDPKRYGYFPERPRNEI